MEKENGENLKMIKTNKSLYIVPFRKEEVRC